MNPVLELMSAHRTIRRFRPDEVPDDAVRGAVAAAQMASTSSNIQAYSLLRVRAPQEREELVELTGGQPQVAQAGAFFVVSGDQRRHMLLAARHGRPYVANLETALLAVIDASLFAQNLVLAFESMGYGICYIGGLRNRLAEVDALLELPEHVLALYGLCVGVPHDDPSPRPRLPVEGVLFEGRYPSDETLLSQIDRYDEVMAKYYGARGQKGYDWSHGITRKFLRANREHLAEFYASKGMRLR